LSAKTCKLEKFFVPHCVKVLWLIAFYYAGLAKTSKKKLRTIRFVAIIVEIRNRCESCNLYGIYEAVSGAVALNSNLW